MVKIERFKYLGRILYCIGGKTRMNKILLLMGGLVFVLGWLSSNTFMILADGSLWNDERAKDSIGGPKKADSTRFGKTSDRPSPHDWVKEDQIFVYNDRVVIDMQDVQWASFTDTNSMDPVFDAGSNALEIVPESSEDIHVGDIVSYKSELVDGTIIHRVIHTGEDEDGWYARMQGDNLDREDPEKVRFDQIQRVVVAIIY